MSPRFLRFKWLFVLLLFAWSNAGWAQSTVVLIGMKNAATESSDTWWTSNPPSYSANMQKLFKGLESGGVSLLRPTSVADISSVLRQPELSQTNAINLARLLGAERALIGTLEIHSLPEISVLPIFGRRVSLVGSVVDLKTNAESTLELSSIAWNRDADAALKAALSTLGEDAAKQIVQPKRSVLSGPTGYDSGHFQVRIKTESGKWFDETVNWLLSTGKVSEVEFSWIATGSIALHLISTSNARMKGPEVNALMREMVNQDFEGFDAMLSTHESADRIEVTLKENVTGIE